MAVTAGQGAARKAWASACQYHWGERLAKPCVSGLTMVMDKGMGLVQTEDLLRLASGYVDFVKLAFGTSAFYDRDVLRQKVALAASFGVHVYPGGTFLELAYSHGRMAEFLREAEEVGFRCLEVSDGTIPMTLEQRRKLVRALRGAGSLVLTEVGKKHPADRVPNTNIREVIEDDLGEGAFKVIIAGRESGKGVVIYRADGSIDDDELELLTRDLGDVDALIWEAPLKDQQQDLILRFGPNVNLGNVRRRTSWLWKLSAWACGVTPCGRPSSATPTASIWPGACTAQAGFNGERPASTRRTSRATARATRAWASSVKAATWGVRITLGRAARRAAVRSRRGGSAARTSRAALPR